MKYEIVFENGKLEELRQFRCQKGMMEPFKVVTTRQAAHLLQRTRRQIYRYVDQAHLHPHGPFLGELLFEKEEVNFLKRLLKNLRGRLAMPRAWQILFPEYHLSDLNWREDRDLILSRILDRGTRKDIQNIFRAYARDQIKAFLKEGASKALSVKSFHYWAWLFGVPLSRVKGAVLLGRKLGGMG